MVADKKPAEHPKYSEMIAAAIVALKERNGSSRQAIVKYIAANYKVGDSAGTHVKLALKRGVAGGASCSDTMWRVGFTRCLDKVNHFSFTFYLSILFFFILYFIWQHTVPYLFRYIKRRITSQ